MSAAERGNGAEAPTAHLWEWTATLDEGMNLTTGQVWRGHRVRYRRQGSRAWRSFLLAKDDGSLPTESEVLEAIEAAAVQP